MRGFTATVCVMNPAASLATAGHLLDIDPDECRRLLSDTVIGRVAWLSTTGLVSLPVTFGVHHDGRLGFRVAPGTLLAELREPTAVAFEADDIDTATAVGWSVLVRGTASAWVGDYPEALGRPWAPGDRTLAVQIAPQHYSGRSVSAD